MWSGRFGSLFRHQIEAPLPSVPRPPVWKGPPPSIPVQAVQAGKSWQLATVYLDYTLVMVPGTPEDRPMYELRQRQIITAKDDFHDATIDGAEDDPFLIEPPLRKSFGPFK